jgi:hypothetical protein
LWHIYDVTGIGERIRLPFYFIADAIRRVPIIRVALFSKFLFVRLPRLTLGPNCPKNSMAALDVVTSALKEIERVSGIEPPSKAWELDHGPFPNNGLAPNLLSAYLSYFCLSPITALYRVSCPKSSQDFSFLASADREGDRD